SASVSIVSRVASLPLVSSAYDKASTTYTATKEDHPLIKTVCDVAEMGAKTVATAAAGGVQPILTTFEPQIAAVNEYACKGLDKLEEKLPILQQPVISNIQELVSSTVTDAKDAVFSTATEAKDAVTGILGIAKGTVQDSMETTRSVMTHSMSAIMESSVGQKVVSSIDALLGISEELVDHYLPITDEELGQEQQREPKSYYVRLGSLSTKLRQRAYQHSLGKVKQAGQSTKEALLQLQQTIALIDYAKEVLGQKFHDGQERLNQMWLEWSRREFKEGEDRYSSQPEMTESQILAVSHRIIQHLQAVCLTLVFSIQGLPANMQDRVQQIQSSLEELHVSFSTAASFQDLSSSILSQSQEKVTKAQESVDELLEYVAHNIPLSWIVGPFAPSRESNTQDGSIHLQRSPLPEET
uniref:Perilipin n=1 Tax=Pelusios castaneus TaxID=367368 RepID=A0A8C8VJI0_9SAUR